MLRNVVVVTYSRQPELAEFAHSILDLPYRCEIINKWSGAYVEDLMQIDADWIVHLDEDAFVFRAGRIEGLLDFMDVHGFACCGVPDGGVIPHRFHNPVSCNPFFTVINRKQLLSSYRAAGCVARSDWDDSYRSKVPRVVHERAGDYSFDQFEPYYRFYFWLCRNDHRILYLDARPWIDEPEQISTVLMDHAGEPFLLHSWYAREYKTRVKRWPLGARLVCRLSSRWTFKHVEGAHYHRIRRVMEAALVMKCETSGITPTQISN